MSLPRLVHGVGVASVGLAAAGLARPRALASAAGVRTVHDASVPLLVRLASARQLVLGLALLTRSPVDVSRSAALFLPLTALDLVAVGAGVRSGVLAPRALAMSTAVLAANAAVARAAR